MKSKRTYFEIVYSVLNRIHELNNKKFVISKLLMRTNTCYEAGHAIIKILLKKKFIARRKVNNNLVYNLTYSGYILLGELRRLINLYKNISNLMGININNLKGGGK